MSENPALAETTVVVVNYNSIDVIGNCIEPLLAAKEIIVVDNDSTDGSLAMIAERFPSVRIIRTGENAGNGAGLNVGIFAAKTPYVLLIDPDAVLTPENLQLLYQGLQDFPDAAFTAPRLYVPRHGQDLWVMGPGETMHSRTYEIPEGPFCSWFLAATVIYCHTDIIQKLGGFDDKIFLYLEDLDLCMRFTQAGYSMVAIPEAAADHFNSYSASRSWRLHWRKDWNFAWSHLYLAEKFEGRSAMWREARKLFFKRGPKALFYALTFDRKRFVRDFSATHAVYAYLLGRNSRSCL